MLFLTPKNVLDCEPESRANEARYTTCKMFWNPRPRRRPGWSQGTHTQPLPNLEEEVTSTVPVVRSTAPISGGSSSSTDVPVNSSASASVRVEDMVQTSVLVPSDGGIPPSNAGTVGSLCFSESKAQDFEKLTDFVLTSNAYPGKPSRESVQRFREDLFGDVCSGFERSLLASSTNVQCSLA